jgi:hypothetical protein
MILIPIACAGLTVVVVIHLAISSPVPKLVKVYDAFFEKKKK